MSRQRINNSANGQLCTGAIVADANDAAAVVDLLLLSSAIASSVLNKQINFGFTNSKYIYVDCAALAPVFFARLLAKLRSRALRPCKLASSISVETAVVDFVVDVVVVDFESLLKTIN